MPNAPAIGWRNGFRSPARKSIDWTNPMAAKLVSFYVPAGASAAKDLVGTADIPAYTAAAANGSTQYGPGMVNTAVNQGANLTVGASHPLCIQPPLTLMWVGTIDSNPDVLSSFVGLFNNNAATNPLYGYGIRVGGAYSAVEFYWNNGGSNSNIGNGAVNSTTPCVRVLIGTIESGVGAALWSNGQKVTSGAIGATTINYSATANFGIFSDQGTSRSTKSTFNAGAVWNRALTDAEIIRISADPFLFLKA
jgi:hypothetical protein